LQHWIEEDGERSSQVRPLIKGKIWTLNENDDDDDIICPIPCYLYLSPKFSFTGCLLRLTITIKTKNTNIAINIKFKMKHTRADVPIKNTACLPPTPKYEISLLRDRGAVESAV